MGTVTVRKFALSPTAGEVLDFTEEAEYFDETLTELGFAKSGTYTYRYQDDECMMKTELSRSKDGFFVWVYVQAMDEHAWRAREVADNLGAHLVENASKG
jgi:hypothetical protein